MSISRGILGGLIGGLLGAAAWTAMTYASGYEVGLLAWVLGLLVGVGFVLGFRGNGSTATGLAAAAVAIAALLVGKAGVVAITINQMMAEAMEEGIDEDTALAYLCAEIVEQWQAEGRTLEWPNGLTEEDAEMAGLWPVGAESAAQFRWLAMPESGQRQYIAALEAQREQDATAAMGVFLVFALIRSFGIFDLLWCGLAISTAFKIAATGADPQAANQEPLLQSHASPVPAQARPAPSATPSAATNAETILGSPLRGIRTDDSQGDRLARGIPAAWADKPLMAGNPAESEREAA